MNIKELSQSIDKLKADKETKNAILEVIDLKINNDMNTFSEELKQTKESLQNQMKLETGSMKSEISSMKWILGIGIALITILLAIIALK